MRSRTFRALFCAFLALLVFPACTTTDTGGGPAGVNPYAARAFDLGVKLGTYKALQQNPEFIDLAYAVADFLESADRGEDLLGVIRSDLLPRYIEDPEHRILASELIDTFADLFRAQVAADSRFEQLAPLAQSIRQGVTYALLNPAR